MTLLRHGLSAGSSLLLFNLMLQHALWETVEAMHPDCALVFQHMKAQDDCDLILRQEKKKKKKGSSRTGYIHRNCTEDGWSDVFPSYEDACEFSGDEAREPEMTYFSNFKQMYTAGYATSLISLILAIFVFTVFR
ncbi:hypothetical protein INR49_008324 [Caranx melampygus]|nr:hypothetical protein INR49_008324 [Caranx melampygus]